MTSTNFYAMHVPIRILPTSIVNRIYGYGVTVVKQRLWLTAQTHPDGSWTARMGLPPARAFPPDVREEKRRDIQRLQTANVVNESGFILSKTEAQHVFPFLADLPYNAAPDVPDQTRPESDSNPPPAGSRKQLPDTYED